MKHPRSSPKVYRALLWVALFSVAVAGTAVWARADLVPFFLTRASINGAIVVLLLLGLAICLSHLFLFLIQARRLDWLAASFESRIDISRFTIEDAVESIGPGLIRDRCLRTLGLVGREATNVSESLTLLSDADVEWEESRGILVRYLLGVLVFLGLMGTFWGVLLTVSGVQQVLSGLQPERVNDAVKFVSQLQTSMGGLLGGLSTAFSTSLFGLGGSVILGFVDVQTRRARAGVLADLDRFVVSVLVPAASPPQDRVVSAGAGHEAPEPVGGELYMVASQQALAENLRRLTDVIIAQTTTDEKVSESLVEIKGMLETLREEETTTRDGIHIANQMRQGLMERLDILGRHMERLVKETRLGRDSAEETSQALLDRMKLEGEITNKTLSIGFSDLMRKFEPRGPKQEQTQDSHEGEE